MNEQISIVQIIQLMLAPGVMISACGLLLLGMNNKYSLVVNRIRLLNEERRKFFSKAGERDFNYEETIRLESISKQLNALVNRVRLVKNAVFFYTIAVALFVITSLIIGILYFYEVPGMNLFVTVIFLLGMISVLIGVAFAAFETKKGFEIIKLEVKIDE